MALPVCCCCCCVPDETAEEFHVSVKDKNENNEILIANQGGVNSYNAI